MINIDSVDTNQRYKTNPFVENMQIETVGKRVVVSPMGKDNHVLVDQITGEKSATHVVSFKKRDKEKFVKVFARNIAMTFDLQSCGLKAFNVLIWTMQERCKDYDVVTLDMHTLNEFKANNQLQLSVPTFRRGLSDLVKARIIAKAVRLGTYFINPNFIFNGDRVVFTTVLEREKNENINQIPN